MLLKVRILRQKLVDESGKLFTWIPLPTLESLLTLAHHLNAGAAVVSVLTV